MDVSDYAIPETYGVNFEIKYVEVDGHRHRVAETGNPEGTPIVIMMGVFEDSLMDSRWLAACMANHPVGPQYRIIVVTVPYLEEYSEIRIDGNTMSKYDGLKPPNKIIKMKGTKAVDPRFDLEHGGPLALRSILTGGLDIQQAHFVGHDRGCIIMDNMLSEYPEMALSYSRGSQGWTKFEEEWADLWIRERSSAPHTELWRRMPSPCSGALSEVEPHSGSSPSFAIEASSAAEGTDLRERWNAIQGMGDQTDRFFEPSDRSSDRQISSTRKRRTDRSKGFCIVDTDFPMMQFQGEDEMIRKGYTRSKKNVNSPQACWIIRCGQVTGLFRLFRLRFPTYIHSDLDEDFGVVSNHTGDQPYWGKWNFFPDEVEDISGRGIPRAVQPNLGP